MNEERSLCAAGAALLSTGCFRSRTHLSPEHACWYDENAYNNIRREMVCTLLERQGGSADRLRRLAAVPLQADSIRAHTLVVMDGATCVRAAKELIDVEPGEAFALLRIGASYWVRSTRGGGIVALDDQFRTVMSIIDLD